MIDVLRERKKQHVLILETLKLYESSITDPGELVNLNHMKITLDAKIEELNFVINSYDYFLKNGIRQP